MLPSHPRIFLGTEDRGSVLTCLAEGFRANGCSTTTMVKHLEIYEKHLRYDIVRGRELLMRFDYERRSRPIRGIARRVDLALSVLLNGLATPSYLDHDVYVFVAGPWAPAPLLYPLLRRLGKKIVAYYLGTDVRHPSAYFQEFGVDTSSWGPVFQFDPLDRKLQHIRWDELHADAIYSVPEQSGLQIRPYYHVHLPVRVELQRRTPDRRVPVVLHAPTRPRIKGTAFVLAAVEQLRREGVEFEFRMLTDVPRAEVLGVLRSTDIVIDELFFRGPGVLCAEAMAAGCATATRILEPPMPFFDAPVCPITPETITSQLRRLITDIPYRVDLAGRGADWAVSEFDPTRITARILRHLRGELPPEYAPSFYLDCYRPPSPLSARSRRLSLEVAERFRPEKMASMEEAARRGVVATRRDNFTSARPGL